MKLDTVERFMLSQEDTGKLKTEVLCKIKDSERHIKQIINKDIKGAIADIIDKIESDDLIGYEKPFDNIANCVGFLYQCKKKQEEYIDILYRKMNDLTKKYEDMTENLVDYKNFATDKINREKHKRRTSQHEFNQSISTV